ncbi:hypothetical protein [Campylobacter gastrosuis]|uniref:Quinolinate phosphoribosyl transferase C-terminal domain-containing protein n=1 Tax=Campylobacter gastrosuis TaxID=2974576 RepID=A0ABT7HP46_9BACT|nr:hypothetical protein [Campylobacter gastrosuis]MDL0088193.1 hypothetical protein [Campylobacter gastrosuis]
MLATTRKHHPFAKELCVKAVIAGGGTIHRLGLFDSVLFFKNHTIVYENFAKFCEKIPVFKAKMPEKKIMVECEGLDEFYELLKHCPDVVVCDKFTPLMIDECLKIRNDSFKNLIIAAAGGISLKNCDEFAKSDIIITSAPYTQGVCDLGSKIEFA